MMEKLLICLYVPAIGERFDLFVPRDCDIGTLTKILADGVVQLSDGRFDASGKEMLAMKDPDLLLHPARCLEDYAVRDGAQLVLL